MAQDPSKEPTKKELKQEIATTQDGKDITRGYVNGLPLLAPSDTVLQLKGAGDYKVYMGVLSDDEVKSSFGQRTRAVIARPWEVRPGGKKAIDKKAADFVKKVINNLKFDDLTEKMLYGVFYGYSVAEVIWDEVDGHWVIADIKVRDRRRFAFDPDMSLLMKTMQHPLGEALPPYKFWCFSTGAEHDDEPYGTGLAHWLYWPVFFKRNGVRFWLTFLEKFGTPTAKGTYPSGTPEAEQDKLLSALRDIQNDSAFIVPDGMVTELLEAKRGGTADYKALVNLMNDAISKVVVGQTASSGGTPGKLGNEELQGDVRLDIVKADADLICMSLNDTVIKWLVDFNFAGAAYPQVWRVVAEPEDLDKRADRDKKLHDIGYKATLTYIHEAYGGEYVEVKAGAAIPAKGETTEFAEGDDELFPDQQALDLAVEALTAADGDQVSDEVYALIKPLIDAIEAAEPADILADLTDRYPDMDSSKLEELLARTYFVSEVWGRLNA